MQRVGQFLAAILMAGPAFASPVTVKVPNQGWSIVFDAPALSGADKGTREDGGFAYRATSGRFNLSLFVEPPAGPGQTHQDCYQHYWSLSQKNPMVAKDTVVITETAKYVRVQYDLVGSEQGQRMRATTVHYYFAYRGWWIDVHISIAEPDAADAAIFASFDRSLDYGPPGAAPWGGAPPAPAPASPALGSFLEGGLHYLRRDYPKAIEHFARALELEKQEPTLTKESWRVLIDDLGIAYGMTGDFQRSKETLEYGISKDGRYPMFYYNLACTFAEMNELEGAIVNLRKAYKYKDNQLPGERMPDPRSDSSFRRFLQNERFLAVLREGEKAQKP